MKLFLKHSDEEYRACAIMIMSSLVNEDEASILEDSGKELYFLTVCNNYVTKLPCPLNVQEQRSILSASYARPWIQRITRQALARDILAPLNF